MEKTGVDDLIEDLNRIPPEIDSRVFIDDIAEALADKLRKKINLK